MEGRNSGGLHSGGLHSRGLHSGPRILDLAMRIPEGLHSGGLHSGGLHSGGLLSRATDFGIWIRTYRSLGVYILGAYTLGV